MRYSWMMALWLMPVLGAGPGPTRQEGESLLLTTARFYGAEVGTTVEASCRVPFGLLEHVEGGASAFAAYRVQVVVRDSTGLALTEQTWAQRVPAQMLTVPGASSVEQFSFRVPAGRYAMDLTVTDSASGRVARTHATVVGFASPPPLSDLVLTTAIRPAPDSLSEGSGEFRRGGFFVTAQPLPVLTPSSSRLFYYLELYPERVVTATLQVRVRTAADGRAMIATPAESVSVTKASVVATGIDLMGLPPGEYLLDLEFQSQDTTLVRSGRFTMAGFETEGAIAAAVERSRDLFDPLTEDQLDTLYRPLIYLMEAGERGVYEGLSVEGKRNYLRQFWARRDPSPATPGNEFQDQFYRLIARANRDFREGGAAEVPGWRTDRGRIHVRYGEPDEVLRRPQSGATNPYEVWKYTHGRLRKFVFYDETGIGNYALIWTNEQREPSRANWAELLGPEGVQDVERF